MPDYMLRPEPKTTLTDLRRSFDQGDLRSVRVDSAAVAIDATEDRIVRFEAKEGGGSDSFEVALNSTTIGHLADWLAIPRPFLVRQPHDVQEFLLNTLLARKPGDIMIDFGNDGIQEIRSPDIERIDPRAVIDIAMDVVGEDGVVIDGWRDMGEYRFDVVVRDGADFGIGGDPAVGDLTRGGLRFGQDTQHRLAPWVSMFLFRLACTNGMEVADVTPAVSFRGTMAQAMDSLRENAQACFDMVEHRIAAFYDLREQKVGSASRTIRRLQREQGFSKRVLGELLDLLPNLVDEPEDASMFDVVNAITNMGNHSDLLGRPNARRRLEMAGGAVVNDHSARCPQCQSVLVGA